MMRSLFIGRLGYLEANGKDAVCWVQVYSDPAGDRPHTVIFTDLEPASRRRMPLRMAERAAGPVATHYGLDPDTTLWVEHWLGAAKAGHRAGFQRVAFETVTRDSDAVVLLRPFRATISGSNVEAIIAPLVFHGPDADLAKSPCLVVH